MNLFSKVSALLLTVLYQSSLYADAGVSIIVIMLSGPVFLLSLIPIIGIEYLILKKYLIEITPKKIFSTTVYANILSTIVGLPLGSICMFIIETNTHINYRIAMSRLTFFAWIMLFILFSFIISCIVEYFVFKNSLKNQVDFSKLKKAIIIANIASYIFLTMVIIICFNVLPSFK
jgi:hypothetical protein